MTQEPTQLDMLPETPADYGPCAWPFEGFTRHSFGLIHADPPWRFKTWSQKGEISRHASAHYPVMSLADIKALPVAQLAAKDCALVMWFTQWNPHQAVDVARSWGFTVKSMGTWVKLTRKGDRLQYGLGRIHRSTAEFWLIATRGSPRVLSSSRRNVLVESDPTLLHPRDLDAVTGLDDPRLDGDVIVAPAREHSRKPEEIYGYCQSIYGGPYLDVFARATRPGWSSWGNEVGKFNEPDLAATA